VGRLVGRPLKEAESRPRARAWWSWRDRLKKRFGVTLPRAERALAQSVVICVNLWRNAFVIVRNRMRRCCWNEFVLPKVRICYPVCGLEELDHRKRGTEARIPRMTLIFSEA
jgi:hypothetical protein